MASHPNHLSIQATVGLTPGGDQTRLPQKLFIFSAPKLDLVPSHLLHCPRSYLSKAVRLPSEVHGRNLDGLGGDRSHQAEAEGGKMIEQPGTF